mmetsp:Transcript_44024/g.116431  ORF Transcript_44024/g.116431 Transcript_44024/m.116431 type:complete len:500 (-) Transcript_44024:140-1639(-)
MSGVSATAESLQNLVTSTLSAGRELVKTHPGPVNAAAAGVIVGFLYRSYLRNQGTPPTFRSGVPVLGPIMQFLASPIDLITAGYKKCGECFKVNMLAIDMVFLVGSKAQEVFFMCDNQLDQAKMYKFSVPIFGKGVLYDVDHATRLCQIRFIRERLTNDCLTDYMGTLEHEVVTFFNEEWGQKEGVVDIRESMIECLSRTSISCLMGKELRSKLHTVQDGYSVGGLLHILEQGMLPLSVFMPSAPIPRHFKRDAARRQMSKFLQPILDNRRAQATQDDDFLGKLIQAEYPDGRPITDDEIVGMLIAGFFGGMHNSSITTAWTALELFSRPHLVAELRQEQEEVLASHGGKRTFAAYQAMKKLKSTVTETLRMHPPLMLLMRTVIEEIKCGDYRIPAGSVVGVCPPVACRVAADFPDPDTFKPMRFIDGIPDQFAYIAFGAGRRVCKGQEFGFLQIMYAISIMLERYDIELVDGVTKPTFGEGMVLAPTQPCRLAFKPRV